MDKRGKDLPQHPQTLLATAAAEVVLTEEDVPGAALGKRQIASSLMGGYGLSHKRVEDGCKSTCVKFGG